MNLAKTVLLLYFSAIVFSATLFADSSKESSDFVANKGDYVWAYGAVSGSKNKWLEGRIFSKHPR